MVYLGIESAEFSEWRILTVDLMDVGFLPILWT